MSTEIGMRVKYFIGSSATGVSETFIRKGISDMRSWGWKVEVVSGRRSGGNEEVNYSGFSESNWVYKFWRFFSFLKATSYSDNYMELGFKIRQQVALRKLKHYLVDPVDFYWFDYLNYACFAEKALANSKIPFAIAVHGFDASQELWSEQIRNTVLKLKPRFFVSPSFHLRRRLELVGVRSPIHVVPYDSAPVVHHAPHIEYDFIALGRLTAKKCPEAVLMAFELVLTKQPGAKLIWVGSGKSESVLKTRFSHLVDQGSVRFAGAVAHERALQLIAVSKVFVQHSVTSGTGDQEGLPNSIVEAMRNGKPVVSTIHSGIPEVVEDGKSGFLVQEHDYQSFADCMIKLIEDDRLREAMGNEAKAKVEATSPLGSRGKKIQTLILAETR